MAEENRNSVGLATEITIAWLGNPNNRVTPEDVPTFLRTMHAAITDLSGTATVASEAGETASPDAAFTPAVSVRKSLASKDHIISLIDGRPYKTLRRHLSGHGLTPEQYRSRYNLKADYPMVAENYSAARRAMAHKIGLGAKGRQAKSAAHRNGRRAAPPNRAEVQASLPALLSDEDAPFVQ
jgi:predicted transcriptional regulator